MKSICSGLVYRRFGEPSYFLLQGNVATEKQEDHSITKLEILMTSVFSADVSHYRIK
jgi:hypothetical protein